MKIINCSQCNNEVKLNESGNGYLKYECKCGFNGTIPAINPNIKEVEEDYELKINNDAVLIGALRQINDLTYDYDGCNSVESFKNLIDEIKGIAQKSLKEYNK